MRIPSEGRGLKEDASGRAGASPNWREVRSILLFSPERKHYLCYSRDDLSRTQRPRRLSRAIDGDASRSEAALIRLRPREQSRVSAGKELRVQQGGKDCVAGLSLETEQALGLRRREAETGHLEVFRANSAQQFCRWDVHTRTRSHNGPPLSKGSPARRVGRYLPLQAEHARRERRRV
jgi:hypothetical protein